MTWNELGWFAASLMPALVIITYIGVAISAIRERHHPSPPDDQGWAH